jgi:hypothetical protein
MQLRPLLFVLVLAAVGCSGVSQPVTGPVFDEFGCQEGCARCAPDAQCISAPYVPACLARCASALDCDPGTKCAVVAGNETRSPVCLPPAALMVCHQPDCQITAQCKSDSISLVPLPRGFTACGWEVVLCDSGCDPNTGACK